MQFNLLWFQVFSPHNETATLNGVNRFVCDPFWYINQNLTQNSKRFVLTAGLQSQQAVVYPIRNPITSYVPGSVSLIFSFLFLSKRNDVEYITVVPQFGRPPSLTNILGKQMCHWDHDCNPHLIHKVGLNTAVSCKKSALRYGQGSLYRRLARMSDEDLHAELRGIPVHAEPIVAVFEAHDSVKSQCNKRTDPHVGAATQEKKTFVSQNL